LLGLNVTIPFKESVIPYLDDIDDEAKAIGSVNLIKIDAITRKLTGFNSDHYGFSLSLKPLLTPLHIKALIIGTGGSSKAVHYALQQQNISCLFVSRNPKNENHIRYQDVDAALLSNYTIIVNTTPVGMFPDVQEIPNINLDGITSHHLVYDLIYNPEETSLLKASSMHHAMVKNGLDMLILQAEKSWEKWMS